MAVQCKSDMDCLFDVLKKNKDFVKDFCIYESLGRTMAASGSGLHYLRDTLAGITQFCPGAFLEPVTVKMAMMRLIDSDTSVNGNEKNRSLCGQA